MITLKDQINNTIELVAPAKRIVCLVPSLTELLYDLKLDAEVIGITKFCVHPKEWRKQKTIVGGTKNFHLTRIESLKPDLIIANKEENPKELIVSLKKKFEVYISDIQTLEDCYQCIEHLGFLSDRSVESKALVHQMKESFDQLSIEDKHKSVAYCIWKEPWMFAGRATFIDHMLGVSGLSNVMEEERYPAFSLHDVKLLAPNYIFLSSEPYPFKTSDVAALRKEFPLAQIFLVDGEMFSWYGSRLLQFPKYIHSLLTDIEAS